MNDAERTRRFRAARREAARARTRIQRETRDEVLRLLREAERRIRAVLAGTPSEFEAFRLPQLQREVAAALAEFGERASARLSTGAGEAWQAGVDLVDQPLEAGGVRVAAALGALDTRQLMAMQVFMTDRIRDVGMQAVTRINGELGLVIIGAQSPSEAVGAIARILGKGGRARAITITRTELGRAFSAAAQQRLEQARERLPGLKKQWRRSGKLHPRPNHDAIDGQIRDVDEPFRLGNGVELMYPRDPSAPAAETINCGCESLPWVEHWEMKQPGAKPLTPGEVRARSLGRFERARRGPARGRNTKSP